MTTPKAKGGLSLPDIHKYHTACHLTRIIDWHIHKSTKDWVDLEESFASVPIAHLPWIAMTNTPKEYASHPVMGPTLSAFRSISQSLHWYPAPGPLTPLVDNPDFAPGMPLRNPSHTQGTPPLRASQFFKNGILLSFTALISHFQDYHIPFFKFLQIRHFLNNARPISQWFRDLTPFESLCTSTPPQRHVISEVYSLLFSNCDPKTNAINQKWETELGLAITTEEWENIYEHIHKGSINVSAQENSYKLYSRWYRTPDIIHRYHSSVSPICWRCNVEVGSLLHIWWNCPRIKPFWEKVQETIAYITTYTLSFTPSQYLLHHSSISHYAYKKSLTLHLVNAAKQCIPVLWRNTDPPTIAMWLKHIERIAGLENLIHQANDSPSKYGKIWACWIHFRESPKYQELLHNP